MTDLSNSNNTPPFRSSLEASKSRVNRGENEEKKSSANPKPEAAGEKEASTQPPPLRKGDLLSDPMLAWFTKGVPNPDVLRIAGKMLEFPSTTQFDEEFQQYSQAVSQEFGFPQGSAQNTALVEEHLTNMYAGVPVIKA